MDIKETFKFVYLFVSEKELLFKIKMHRYLFTFCFM